MPLPSGSFGPYEILAPLGAGGMGEVYRARDRRLGREVALKVLPAELSADADRVARFEQEARSASALNHPNIVTIHEIGRHEETSYISMELVDGRTLRELMAAGPMPIRKLLGIAAQVAEGLAKAHGAGIVHRDLKPENAMVSKDGFVKILDFGLAKLVEPASGEVSAMPTLARAQTHPGVVMGTVAYMSPEQASGEPVDFRSDQFSFGSILYEALGGEKPFARKTAAETMSAIIREEPKPLGTSRPDVPAPLKWIVDRCLAKDPEERYASTRDLARDLAGVRDHVSEITSGAELLSTTKGLAKGRSRRSAGVAAAALILLVGLVGGWIAASQKTGKVSAPTFRRLTYRSGSLQNARFAPDGTIVYGATWVGESPGLYAVRPESPESRSFGLPADILAVSTTGEMAVLLNESPFGGTLARVPFAGGVPRPFVEEVPYASADWSPDGKELLVVRHVEGQFRLEFPLGKTLYSGHMINSPRFNPRGDMIAFYERGKSGSVMVIGSSGDGVRMLASGFELPGGAPCWTPDGKEVWFTGKSEAGKPSSLQAVDLAGRLRLVAQMPGELELDDISPDGRVLLAHHTLITSMRGSAAGDSSERDLTWLDSSVPSDISADGRMVLFSELGEGGGKTSGVYLRNLDGSPALRLGDGRAHGLSPDGKSVLASLPGAADRFVLLPTGTGEPKTIALSGFQALGDVAAWLPDGKEFLFEGQDAGGKWRVYRVGAGGGKPRAISPEGVRLPVFMTGPVSPDGRFFFAARSPGRWFRFPMEGGEGRAIAGLERGDFPIRWASDRSFWVHRPESGEVWHLDAETGRKTPSERKLKRDTGQGTYMRLVMTLDGRAYAFSAERAHAVLYSVEGLR